MASDFPSFPEGLSSRRGDWRRAINGRVEFPFLFGRAFIEARRKPAASEKLSTISLPLWRAFIEAGLASALPHALESFSFLFGGAFIEAVTRFSGKCTAPVISLPIWRGFH